MAQVEKIPLHTQHDAAAVVAQIEALRAKPDRTQEETATMEWAQSLRKRLIASLRLIQSPTEADRAALVVLKRRIR